MKKQIIIIVLLVFTAALVRAETSTFAFEMNGHKHNMSTDFVRRAVQEWYDSSIDTAALQTHIDSLARPFGLKIENFCLPEDVEVDYLIDSIGARAFMGHVVINGVFFRINGIDCSLYCHLSNIGLQFGGNSHFDAGVYDIELSEPQVLQPVVAIDDSCGSGPDLIQFLKNMIADAAKDYVGELAQQFESFASEELFAYLNPLASLGIDDPVLLAAAVRGFPMDMHLRTEYDAEQEIVQLVQAFDFLTGTTDNPRTFVGLQPALPAKALNIGGFSFIFWNLQRGFSWHPDWNEMQRVETAFEIMDNHDINGYRLIARWKNIQKQAYLGNDLDPANITSKQFTECLSDTAYWNPAEFDNLRSILHRGASRRLTPFMAVGIGNEDAVPVDDSGRIIAPATDAWTPPAGFVGVSASEYLYNLKMYATAVVRYFADKVDVWQVENELNAAGWAAADSTWWRKGDLWQDESFRNQVWEVLVQAVRDHDPSARILHDFHILDIMPALESWLDDLDMVGVNFYPNAAAALPVFGFSVGEYVWAVRRALQGLGAPHKPVWVIETGYPGQEQNDPPDSLLLAQDTAYFSENRQSEYIQTSLASAVQNGATGFFYFSLSSPENDDESAPELDRHLRYCGLIRSGTDTPKLGLQVFADLYNRLLNPSIVYDNKSEFHLSLLLSNSPNPFNERTCIEFQLPRTEQVLLFIVNILGQHVCTIVDKKLLAGQHSVIWQGRTSAGHKVASGIYFGVIKTQERMETFQILLLR